MASLSVALGISALSVQVWAEQPVGIRKTQVTLDDPGAEPRQQVRYEVQTGTTERMEIRFDMRIRQEFGDVISEIAFPRLILTAEVKTEEVEQGKFQLSGSYVSVEIQRPAVEEEVEEEVVVQPSREELQELGEMLEPMVGATFSGQLNDRGIWLDYEFELTAPMAFPLAGLIEGAGLDKPLDFAIEAFPAEPIGPGATWKVDAQAEALGIVTERTIRSELTGWEERVASIQGTLQHVAEDQQMQVPGAAAEAQMHVIRTVAQGERHVQMRRDRFIPVTAVVEARTETEMQFDVPAREGRTRQIVTTTIRFRSVDQP